MTDQPGVVIVGGGQAGLAVSWELSRAGVEHVVLERGRVGQSWRARWDSFCLVTPNWSLQLPGHSYDGADPDGFDHRDAVVGSSSATRRMRLCTPASRRPRCGRVPAEDSAWRRRRARLRPVRWSSPRVRTSAPPPAWDALPADLPRLGVEDYRNPGGLPDGPVLVVGSGQSGCQIAEELDEAGRSVVLSCGRAPWAPRRIGDRDLVWWLLESGFLDAPCASLPAPEARLARASPGVMSVTGS